MDVHTERFTPGDILAVDHCEEIGRALGVWIYDLTQTGDKRFSTGEVEGRIARSRVLHKYLSAALPRSARADSTWPTPSTAVVEAVELLGLWETGDPRVQIHSTAVRTYWRTKQHHARISG